MSRIGRALGAVVLWLGVAACSERAEGEPVSLGESDAGRDVALAAGTELLVTLPSNRSTGFRWTIRDSAVPALRLEGDAEYAQDSTRDRLTGVPGAETFRFTAVEPGHGALTLGYVRPWEAGVPPAKEFRVRITVR